jgi:hypothetical protein
MICDRSDRRKPAVDNKMRADGRDLARCCRITLLAIEFFAVGSPSDTVASRGYPRASQRGGHLQASAGMIAAWRHRPPHSGRPVSRRGNLAVSACRSVVSSRPRITSDHSRCRLGPRKPEVVSHDSTLNRSQPPRKTSASHSPRGVPAGGRPAVVAWSFPHLQTAARRRTAVLRSGARAPHYDGIDPRLCCASTRRQRR